MKKHFVAATAAALAATCIATAVSGIGTISAQAEETGLLGNTSLRPVSATTYGRFLYDTSSSAWELSSVTTYDTSEALPTDQNAALFLLTGDCSIPWAASTVDYRYGLGTITYTYENNDAGQPSIIFGSDGSSTGLYYDEQGRYLPDEFDSYNANGQLDEIKVYNSFWETYFMEGFQYDDAGRPVCFYSNAMDGDFQASTTLTYDDAGRISTLSYSNSDTNIDAGPDVSQYYYDSLGYLREIFYITRSGLTATMTIFDYGDANSQLGEFTPQDPGY